jgi:hypothetical protein
MGYYINPKDGSSKESFLSKHGLQVLAPKEGFDFSGENWPVCLVDNGAFTAAGIADCPEELDAFKYPDGRPKAWFLVPRVHLEPFCPLAKKESS